MVGHDHHSHASHQHVRRDQNRRRLRWALGLAGVYLVAEAVGGWLTGSLALLADAGHMLTDVAALGLSLFAMWVSRRPASAERTYGYYRAEILAALANGATLIAIAIFIFIEAYQRFRQPAEILGAGMMAIACGGLVVNLAMMAILHGARAESLNVQGAWLHVLGDALGSIGAILAGLLILVFGWNWADPLAGVAIALLILVSSWRLVQEAVAILMEAAPAHIDVDRVRDRIISVPGVLDVHDLHVWTITSNLEALSAHVTVADYPSSMPLLGQIRRLLHEEFSIDHVTLQLEPDAFEEKQTLI